MYFGSGLEKKKTKHKPNQTKQNHNKQTSTQQPEIKRETLKCYGRFLEVC